MNAQTSTASDPPAALHRAGDPALDFGRFLEATQPPGFMLTSLPRLALLRDQMALDEDLDTLFRRYGPLVYRRALQIMGRPDLAEEAVQEVFIRAMKHKDRFDPRAKPSTWLYRITTNYCLNQIRDRKRRSELLDQRADEVTPASIARDPQRMATLRALLADADPRQAEAATAVYVDGMSHAEAAEVIGVSRRTVGNLCDRFVHWARERLSDAS